MLFASNKNKIAAFKPRSTSFIKSNGYKKAKGNQVLVLIAFFPLQK